MWAKWQSLQEEEQQQVINNLNTLPDFDADSKDYIYADEKQRYL